MIKRTGVLVLVSLIISVFTSCSPFKNKTYKTECKKVIAAFKNSFERQDSGIFLLKEGHELSTFSDLYGNNFTRCFDGLHKDDLIKLFGEPSVKNKGGYLYYLNEKCLTSSQGGCLSFSFMFDSNNEYVQVSVYLSESYEPIQ